MKETIKEKRVREDWEEINKKKNKKHNKDEDDDNVHEWDDIDETKKDEKIYYNIGD